MTIHYVITSTWFKWIGAVSDYTCFCAGIQCKCVCFSSFFSHL